MGSNFKIENLRLGKDNRMTRQRDIKPLERNRDIALEFSTLEM
jgi:hypothetical protein